MQSFGWQEHWILNFKMMLSDRISPRSLLLTDNHHKLNLLNRSMHLPSQRKTSAFKWAMANITLEKYVKFVCLHQTNYLAYYTLGKLILQAKDFIIFITTNIVLEYKLPGSLDSVTFYFYISNRFIICSGKSTFSL